MWAKAVAGANPNRMEMDMHHASDQRENGSVKPASTSTKLMGE